MARTMNLINYMFKSPNGYNVVPQFYASSYQGGMWVLGLFCLPRLRSNEARGGYWRFIREVTLA